MRLAATLAAVLVLAAATAARAAPVLMISIDGLRPTPGGPRSRRSGP